MLLPSVMYVNVLFPGRARSGALTPVAKYQTAKSLVLKNHRTYFQLKMLGSFIGIGLYEEISKYVCDLKRSSDESIRKRTE